MKKIPEWFSQMKMRRSTRDRLVANFTFTQDGYVRWHAGKTRFVAGRMTNPEMVDDMWVVKKKEIDADVRGEFNVPVGLLADPETVTVVIALDRFFRFLDMRVESGIPEPIAPRTRSDYIVCLRNFANAVGGGRPLASVGPADFEKLAIRFSGNSPSTFARNVAYIKSFFNWCKKNGILKNEITYGSYFAKPSRQKHRDKRMDSDKGFEPKEIIALWKAADTTERLWIALGLTGAMDNADIANFEDGLINRKDRIIDYRRRKVGKIRRIIPIHAEIEKMIRKHKRPAPACPEAGGLFFLTPTGLPLARALPSIKHPGAMIHTDAIQSRFRNLMIKAGLRGKPSSEKTDGKISIKYPGDADGRGFRSLRTTFPNLAPPGFKEEIELIMGHVGGVLIENYLEKFGDARLRELVNHVWNSVFTSQRSRGAFRHRQKSSASVVA